MPTATIYSNVEQSAVLSNPFSADGNGRYSFFAPSGAYTVSIASAGYTNYSFPVTLGGSGGSSVTWQNQGSGIGTPTNINCSTNLACSYATGTVTIAASGGSSAAGSAGTLQCTNGSGILTACGVVDNGTTLAIARDPIFQGPNPYYDVRNKGARSINPNTPPQIAGITANCTSGSAVITISNASTFQNGDPVLVLGCGAPQSMTTPTITSVTPSVTRVMTGVGDDVAGPTGSTSYGPYQVVWCDLYGGCTAPSTGFSITNGQASLGAQSAAITSETRVGQIVTATTAAHGLPVSCSNPSCPMVLTSGTSDGTFLGQWHVASVPDTTHFTYVGGLSAATGYSASSSSTGGYAYWWNLNRIVFPAETGGYQAFIYKSGTILGSALPLNPTNAQMLDASLSFDDYGSTMHTGFSSYPIWVPASVPAAATSDALSTTICSGAGTTTLTLCASAGTTKTGATIVYDSTPAVKAAAVAAGGQSVYIPQNVTLVLNSNLDLSATNSSIVGGNNMVMRATMLMGGFSKWQGNVFPFVGSQGSFQPQSNPQIYCEANPCLHLVNNASDFISNFQFNGESNGQVMMLADGGGGSPHGTFQNVYWGVGSGGYLSIPVWLRGASDNSSSGGGQFYAVNVLGNQGGYGVTDTPVFYADNGYITANNLWLSGQGVLQRSGPSGGNGLTINGFYIQGGFEPVFTTTGLKSSLGVGSNISINYGEMDTTSSNLVNYIQSNSSSSVVASITGLASGPDSGYTVVGGQPLIYAPAVSGQNTVPNIGTNFEDQDVYVYGAGEFSVPMTTPGAPTAAVSSGGSVPVGTHLYGIIAVDGNGKLSYEGPTVSAIVTTGNQTVTVTPPTAPAGAVSYYPVRDGLYTPGSCTGPYSFSTSFVDTFAGNCNNSPPFPYLPSFAAQESLSPNGLSVTNIIDTTLTPGTSPICPNGTNGAFTTVGCSGGGGGGGTPGGSSTDVQFNSSGSFGGDSGFTYGSGAAVLSHSLFVGSGNSTDHISISSQGATLPSSGTIRMNNAGTIYWENQYGSGYDTLSLAGDLLKYSNTFSSAQYATATACASSASPAVCSAASSGFVALPAGSTTLTVNTTAVTANSQIHLTEDESVGTNLTVTCNTQSLTTLGSPRAVSRVVGTSFTISIDVAPTTNPMCISYTLVN
ncbi:MAG: hypothetical protein WBA09_22370 [Candidatus Acidiferrum sp.]